MAQLRDLGMKAAVKQARKLRGVKVGLLENSGNYPDGTSVVDVGIYNEYGTEKIPARPFMAVAKDQAGSEMYELARHVVGLMFEGRTDAEGVDATVGRAWQDSIKKTITGFDTPANAESTQAAKGRDDPLVDTGLMRDSINWERL